MLGFLFGAHFPHSAVLPFGELFWVPFLCVLVCVFVSFFPSLFVCLLSCGDVHPNPGPTDTGRRRGNRGGGLPPSTGMQPPVNLDDLSFLQLNANGLKSRKVELSKLLDRIKPDVVLLQETGLKQGINIDFPGYCVFRKDRITPRGGAGVKGGGLLTLVKVRSDDTLACRKLPDPDLGNDLTTEILRVELITPNCRRILSNVYIPPIRAATAGEGRRQLFDPDVSFRGDEAVIAGDMNAHNDMWSNGPPNVLGTDIENWCLDNNFQVANSGVPTFLSYSTANSSAPDLTLCAPGVIVSDWCIGDSIGSDHLPIMFTIKDPANDELTLPRQVRKSLKYSWKKADWNLFIAKFSECLQRSFPLTESQANSVQFISELLGKSLRKAARVIPRGCRSDPIIWWNDEVQEAVDRRNAARELAHRSDEDREHWLVLCQEAKRTIIRAKENAWHEFVSTLSLTSDPRKTWKIIKSINRCYVPAKNVAIEHNNKLLITPKDKADAYISMYADVSTKLQIGQDRQVRAEWRSKKAAARRNRSSDNCDCGGHQTGICKPFSMVELRAALNQLSLNRAAGADDIFNEMLLHLDATALSFVLDLFNLSFSTGEVPLSWKLGVIRPIPKHGKDPSRLDSYRPICLTSALSKLMERMIARRMRHLFESTNALAASQSGFRSGRSTTDVLCRLVADIQSGFHKPKPHDRTLCALIDFSRAFDKVDHLLLELELKRLGCPPCILRWNHNFLAGRQYLCTVEGTRSYKRCFTCGVPQGSVLGPLYFIAYVDSLICQLNAIPLLQNGLFADDTTIWTSNSNLAKAADVVQEGLNVVHSWSTEFRMSIAAEKSELILFSNWFGDKPRRPLLHLGGTNLEYRESVKLLGVALDVPLTFEDHVTKIRQSCQTRLQQLRALSATSWGCNIGDMRTLYLGYIRSIIEYGAECWAGTMSKSKVERLERLQNHAARAITGCVRSSNVESLLLEADLVPITTRVETMTAVKSEKLRRLPPGDPCRNVAENPPQRQRLEKSAGRWQNWNHVSDNVLHNAGFRKVRPADTQRGNGIDLSNREPLLTFLRYSPWDCDAAESVQFYPYLLPSDDPNKRRATERTIAARGDHSFEMWTDGSVSNLKGAGAVDIYKEGRRLPIHSCSTASGLLSSSYRAEMSAIKVGLAFFLEMDEDFFPDDPSLLVCTDSQSSIRSLSSGPLDVSSILEAEVWSSLLRLVQGANPRFRSITFQFVSAHCGVSRNEKVDKKATRAAETLNQSVAPMGMAGVRAYIKRRNNERWSANLQRNTHRAQLVGNTRTDIKKYAKLARQDQCLLSQFRVGESRHVGKFRSRIGITDDTRCRWCNNAEESPAHLCHDCPNVDVVNLRASHLRVGTHPLPMDPAPSLAFVRGALGLLI